MEAAGDMGVVQAVPTLLSMPDELQGHAADNTEPDRIDLAILVAFPQLLHLDLWTTWRTVRRRRTRSSLNSPWPPCLSFTL
jgi:hypothetical protein